MTEQTLHAALRLGATVVLRSPRTERTWRVYQWNGKVFAMSMNTPAHGGLTYKQVLWHLANKPDNFSFE